jgi:hypothetical protein
MRLIVLVLGLVVLGCVGIGIAAGIAVLVAKWLPALKVPVFLVISIWWLWAGWKYY